MQRTKQCALAHLNSYFGVMLSHSPKVRFQITDMPWSLQKLSFPTLKQSLLCTREIQAAYYSTINPNQLDNICITESIWSRYYKQQQKSLNESAWSTQKKTKNKQKQKQQQQNINQFAAVLRNSSLGNLSYSQKCWRGQSC